MQVTYLAYGESVYNCVAETAQYERSRTMLKCSFDLHAPKAFAALPNSYKEMATNCTKNKQTEESNE